MRNQILGYSTYLFGNKTLLNDSRWEMRSVNSILLQILGPASVVQRIEHSALTLETAALNLAKGKNSKC